MIILQANKIERSFAGEVLFDNISLQVDERDRIALVGKNGAGKSTLLKILVGEEEPTSGEINKKRDLSLSYLAQDSRFESSNTIYDEMLHVFDDLRKTEKTLRQMELEMGEKTGADLEKLMQDYDRLSEEFRQAGGFTYEADIRAILNGFKFDESMWQMKIEELSGGQNTRLALAKMLLENPDVILLDEPTNYLDTAHIEWLIEYLNDFAGAAMIISHDYDFLERVTNTIVDVSFGKITKYRGSFKQAMRQKEEKKALQEREYEKQQEVIDKAEHFIRKNKAGSKSTMAKSREKMLARMTRIDPPEDNLKASFNFPYENTGSANALRVENIQAGYGKPLLAPVTFSMTGGEKLLFSGFNGVGKTTLIKTILGKIPALSGTSTFSPSAKISYFDQDLIWDDPTKTPLQTIQDQFPTM